MTSITDRHVTLHSDEWNTPEPLKRLICPQCGTHGEWDHRAICPNCHRLNDQVMRLLQANPPTLLSEWGAAALRKELQGDLHASLPFGMRADGACWSDTEQTFLRKVFHLYTVWWDLGYAPRGLAVEYIYGPEAVALRMRTTKVRIDAMRQSNLFRWVEEQLEIATNGGTDTGRL